MKHVSRDKRTGSLVYQRRLPADIAHATGKAMFKRGMECKDTDPETKRNKAWTRLGEEYEALIQYYRNSTATVLEDQEIDRQARAWMKDRGMEIGCLKEFLNEHPKLDLSEIAVDLFEGAMTPDEYALMKSGNPEYDAREEVLLRAYKLATNSAKSVTKYLSECWEVYATDQHLNANDRTTVRRKRLWDRWMTIAGQQPMAKGPLEDALDRYADQRLLEVTSASVERELNEVLAVIRHRLLKERLGFEIRRKKLPKHKAKERPPLEQPEQITLLKHVLNIPVIDKRDHRKNLSDGIALLLYLQGGMMPSECSRLKADRVFLDAAVPHIVIDGETKTEARKRILPITVGLGWIRRAMQTLREIERREGRDSDEMAYALGRDWSEMTETAWSFRLKRAMRKAGIQKTPHSLRHTLRTNAIANGREYAVSTIGGWASINGFSDKMLKYGAAGLSDTDVLKGRQRDSEEIHKHLIEAEKELRHLKAV